MEGATSTLEPLKNGWIRKTLKRSAKKKATPMAKQLELQTWSSGILTKPNGFKILFTPQARSSSVHNSYEMEMIDVSDPVVKIDEKDLQAEIETYFRLAKAAGVYPSDFELYRQSNGRVALVDFDKFGRISGKTVDFPYRAPVSLNTIPEEYLYTEALAERLRNIMKGGRRNRKTRKRNH